MAHINQGHTRAPIALIEANLPSIAASADTPTYPRSQLTPAVVHLGVGGFHRAHQEVYLDDLAQRGITRDWGVCGVGLLPGDKKMRDALLPQDCLYTVVERSAEVDTARIIGSMTTYLFGPDHPERVLKALSAPTTRIVSLTITEGGYNFDQSTGEFDATDADVLYDVEHPDQPKTVFGYITTALNRRRLAGVAPFSVLSCDNIQGNGHMASKMMLAFSALRGDADLTTWIETQVAFPNTMVDRITPQTTDTDRAMVTTQFGIADAWPVMTEPFKQWIIEDTFCNGRPPLEDVGVQFTSDVHPYETMKIRLLNASHSAMSFLGYVAGHRYVHDVMADRLFVAFVRQMMDRDVTPLVPPVSGMNLTDYKATLIERFSNPKIADQLARICFDGSNRVPKFVVPSIHEALAAGTPYTLLTLALAGWFRYLYGVDEQGRDIAIQDPRGERLHGLAQQGRDDPRPLLNETSLFGDLRQHEPFVTLLQDILREMYAHGAHAAITQYLAKPV